MFKRSFTSVGIDVSKDSLDVAVLIEGEAFSKKVSNSNSGIESLIKWLNEKEITVIHPVVIESTGSYHWLVSLRLTDSDFTVKLINPLIAKKYQKASIRDTKTDKVDALRLAEIGIIEQNLPTFFDTREQLSQKRYQSLLAKLNKIKQQLGRAYTDALKAGSSIGITLELDCIEVCLEQIKQAIHVLKKIITKTSSELSRKISAIKGVSLFQATVLCNAVEGKQFEKRDQMIAFFGLDVRQRQSGKWKGKQKLSKRGNSFCRLVLFQIGWSLTRNNPEYHAYYERLFKEQGKHYYTAILATARKFLRYFFTQHQEFYQKIS